MKTLQEAIIGDQKIQMKTLQEAIIGDQKNKLSIYLIDNIQNFI